mmetsp:Transcript_91761/g.186823  ORF Transcript_91761/g.186823 Transcript_91761/m.186823 type:complete len:203 (+) Transcript_91761:97-705(+)
MNFDPLLHVTSKPTRPFSSIRSATISDRGSPAPASDLSVDTITFPESSLFSMPPFSASRGVLLSFTLPVIGFRFNRFCGGTRFCMAPFSEKKRISREPSSSDKWIVDKSKCSSSRTTVPSAEGARCGNRNNSLETIFASFSKAFSSTSASSRREIQIGTPVTFASLALFEIGSWHIFPVVSTSHPKASSSRFPSPARPLPNG